MGKFLALYAQPRILALLFLGFSSGLPLALTASTLAAWLTESGISMAAIGLFAAVSTPYTLKFLWSPLMDGTNFPLLSKYFGHRRGWLLATQLGLVASLLLLGFADPSANIGLTAFLALLVAVCSASQDIVADAFRVELLPPEQQGAGAATFVLGYRLGMLGSSAGGLFFASYFGWHTSYWIMAGLVAVGIATVLCSPEPVPHIDASTAPLARKKLAGWLQEFVVEPFADFMARPHWQAILLFIVFYKLSDAFMGVMTIPFLLTIGFAKTDIATVVKVFGVIATIVGSLIGGAMVFRLGMIRTLWICGIAHMLTNLMFVLQARVGADIHFLALSITLENISGGMGTAAFVAFISNLCNQRFTATQYALLSSLSALGRTWLSTPSGAVASWLGWEGFFTFAAALAIPGLLLLWWLRKVIDETPMAISLPAEATSK